MQDDTGHASGVSKTWTNDHKNWNVVNLSQTVENDWSPALINLKNESGKLYKAINITSSKVWTTYFKIDKSTKF